MSTKAHSAPKRSACFPATLPVVGVWFAKIGQIDPFDGLNALEIDLCVCPFNTPRSRPQ